MTLHTWQRLRADALHTYRGRINGAEILLRERRIDAQYLLGILKDADLELEEEFGRIERVWKSTLDEPNDPESIELEPAVERCARCRKGTPHVLPGSGDATCDHCGIDWPSSDRALIVADILSALAPLPPETPVRMPDDLPVVSLYVDRGVVFLSDTVEPRS